MTMMKKMYNEDVENICEFNVINVIYMTVK